MNSFKNILFIDIETVSQYENFNEVSERLQAHWEKKSKNLKLEKLGKETYFERAAIYAEFGKIICIGVGGWDQKLQKMKLGCIYSHDEKTLLLQFKEILEKHNAGDKLILCAHNGKEFDFPYICRRMLVNGIQLPDVLNISGKKPWEILHEDTMEMWKFGDYKHFTSLDLLATIFDLPGSKNTMDGSMVNQEYYKNKNLEGIAKYCMEDVEVLIQVYLKLIGKEIDRNHLFFKDQNLLKKKNRYEI